MWCKNSVFSKSSERNSRVMFMCMFFRKLFEGQEPNLTRISISVNRNICGQP